MPKDYSVVFSEEDMSIKCVEPFVPSDPEEHKKLRARYESGELYPGIFFSGVPRTYPEYIRTRRGIFKREKPFGQVTEEDMRRAGLWEDFGPVCAGEILAYNVPLRVEYEYPRWREGQLLPAIGD